MSDFILNDNQHVTLTIELVDNQNNIVTGDQLDPGSVKATFQSGSQFSAVVSTDQTTVLVTANGILTQDDVLTVTGSLNGVALKPGTLAFDEDSSIATTVNLVPSTPVNN